jgi:hypothetical protein
LQYGDEADDYSCHSEAKRVHGLFVLFVFLKLFWTGDRFVSGYRVDDYDDESFGYRIRSPYHLFTIGEKTPE